MKTTILTILSMIVTNIISIPLNGILGGRQYETLSARCWRCRESVFFGTLRKLIDTIFFWEDDHCRIVYEYEKLIGIQTR